MSSFIVCPALFSFHSFVGFFFDQLCLPMVKRRRKSSRKFRQCEKHWNDKLMASELTIFSLFQMNEVISHHKSTSHCVCDEMEGETKDVRKAIQMCRVEEKLICYFNAQQKGDVVETSGGKVWNYRRIRRAEALLHIHLHFAFIISLSIHNFQAPKFFRNPQMNPQKFSPFNSVVRQTANLFKIYEKWKLKWKINWMQSIPHLISNGLERNFCNHTDLHSAFPFHRPFSVCHKNA